MTTVGIIGSGQIGTAIARLAVDAGHQVVLSNSRGPETLADTIAALGAHASAATSADAAAAGDIVVVTVPVSAFPNLPATALAGKTVIDTCNYGAERDGPIPELDDKSLTSSELLLRYLPGAVLVKAFNNIFFKHLLALGRPADAADRSYLPIAGDSAAAKAAVTGFLDSLGYGVVDAGSAARPSSRDEAPVVPNPAAVGQGVLMTRRTPLAREAGGEPVRHAVRTYAGLQPQLHEVTERYIAIITTLLDDAGINYLSITGRTKSVGSFAAKAIRSHDGEPLYDDPLTQITDVVGVRVITYLQSDVVAVAQLFADQFTIIDDRDLGEETAREGRFGYASRHLLVSSSDSPDRPASVQVRTVLQHAWAEFEHDIRYKGTVPAELAPDLERRFSLAAGLLELADREFSEIRNQLQASLAARHPDFDPADPRISSQELATFLASQYSDASWSRTDHYAWISGLLLELGITSLDELGGLLASVDMDALITRMGYKYAAGAVRRLDDALLAVFGDRYVGLTGNAHRTTLLTNRLDKLEARPASE